MIENEEESLCEVCGATATGSWLGTEVKRCDNVVCDVALWEIMEYIVRRGKHVEEQDV